MYDVFDRFREHVNFMRRRTEANGSVSIMPLEISALGLIGEMGEFLEADGDERTKEFGDVCFYAQAILLDAGGGTIDTVIPAFVEGNLCWREEIQSVTSKLAEITKKAAWHGKPFDGEEAVLLLRMLFRVSSTDGITDWTYVKEVLTKNIEKLQARYPNGFVVGGGIR